MRLGRQDRSAHYRQNAYAIDQSRASTYWSSTWHELGARAFESFILNQTAKRAERSDYLVYGAKNRFYDEHAANFSTTSTQLIAVPSPPPRSASPGDPDLLH